MSTFGAAQVSLLVEGGLQLKNLLSREDRSGFLFTTLCVQGRSIGQAAGAIVVRVIFFRVADHQFVLVVLNEFFVVRRLTRFDCLTIQESAVLIVVCLVRKGAWVTAVGRRQQTRREWLTVCGAEQVVC